MRLDSIRPTDTDRFEGDLRTGRHNRVHKTKKDVPSSGEKTVRKHVRSLKAVFSWARANGIVTRNPLDDFSAPTIPGEANPYVPVEDFEKVVAAQSTSAAWAALFGLCRLAGLRLSPRLGCSRGRPR
ncbi:MAG: hypothetical protein ACYTF9_04835 [Planctomycetota bacterium]